MNDISWHRKFLISFRSFFTQKVSRVMASLVIVLAVCFFAAIFVFFVDAPVQASFGIVTVHRGMSVGAASRAVSARGFVRFPRALELYLAVTYRNRPVYAGDYLFDEPSSIARIAGRLVRGDVGGSRIKITVPEGLTNAQIVEVLEKNFTAFDPVLFSTLVLGKEGYLFPDTYFFFPSTTTEEIVKKFDENFSDRIEPLEPAIAGSHHSLREIITMASIIEREAAGDTDDERKIISGILWKRIKIGMPLQADATVYYALGKDDGALSTKDLKIKSPYNTYLIRGLPPGPIGNPGISSLQAAIEPMTSPYLFYLHDQDGRIHYARDLNEHIKNKRAYLD